MSNYLHSEPGLPDVLQEVTMTVLANKDCTERWSTVTGATINGGHICIGDDQDSGKSACNVSSLTNLVILNLIQSTITMLRYLMQHCKIYRVIISNFCLNMEDMMTPDLRYALLEDKECELFLFSD